MIEILLVASIMLVMAVTELQRRNEVVKEQTAQAAGVKMAHLEKAVASYAAINYPYLQRMNYPAATADAASLPTAQTGVSFPCPSGDNDKTGVDPDGLKLKCVANGASPTGYAFIRTGDPNCAIHATIPDVCELPLNALIADKHLPVGWSPTTSWESPIRVFFRRVPPTRPNIPASCVTDPTSGNCPSYPITVSVPAAGVPDHPSLYEVRYLIIAENAWADDDAMSNVRWKDLGIAARTIGATGGVSGYADFLAGTSGSGIADGLFGGWRETSVTWPLITRGQLVVSGGAKASSYNKYARRDGSLPMTGALNLNGHQITNARDVFLRGPESNQRNRHVSSLAPNWVSVGMFPVEDGSVIAKPVCPQSDGLAVSSSKYGVPRIKVTMQLLAGDRPSGYNGAAMGPALGPETPPDSARSRHSWRIGASDTGTDWSIYIRREYDGEASGEYYAGRGLAETYCYYYCFDCDGASMPPPT